MKSAFKSLFNVILILTLHFSTVNAQISINSDGSNPDASAMLDVSSTDKGILIPRMTTAERTAINLPATGLLVYDTDNSSFWYYNGTIWDTVNTDTQTLTFENDTLSISNGDAVSLADLSRLNEDGLLISYLELSTSALDVNQNGSDDNYFYNDIWQSFTSNYDGYLAEIKLNIGEVGGSTGATITIYEGEGTGGTQLGVLDVSLNFESTNTFDFSDLQIPIESGQKYTFFLDKSNFGGDFSINLSTTNAYAGGRNGGSSSEDLWFQTYYSTGTYSDQTVISTNSYNGEFGFNLSNIDTISFKDGSFQTSAKHILNDEWLSNDGNNEGISIADNGKVTFSDNIILNSSWISNDGDSEGININNNGKVTFSNNVKLNDNWLSNDGGSEGISIANNGEVTTSGKLTVTGDICASNFSCTSDRRLKTHIQLTKYGLDDILNIDVRDYHFKKDTTEALHTGFIAQQLHAIFPHAVIEGGEDEKTNPWTVDYAKLTPLLVKGMQEQQEVIDEQHKKITALEAQVAKIQVLEKQVSAVETLKQENAEMKAMLEQIQAQLNVEINE